MKRLAFLWLLLALIVPVQAYATLSTSASQITVIANGSSAIFQFPFVANVASDIALIETSSSGAQTTIAASQYSVAVNPPATGQLWGAGGFVTFPLSGSPVAAGTKITIMRVLPLLQTTALSNQGNFYPQAVEKALDTNVMQSQQIAARTGSIRGTWLTGTYYNFGDIVIDGVNGANTGNLYAAALANSSSVWTNDLANGDWSLALNVQGIINANPTIATNSLVGNISGVPEIGYGVTGTTFLDSAFGSAQGSLLYRGASGWTALSPGTSGYFLQTQGSGANPTWVTAGGGLGTITGVSPSSGLAGGGTSGNVPVFLASVANTSLLANVSGSTNPPSATTPTAFLDNVFGNLQGDILYRNGTVWTVLPPGSSGQALITHGSASNPTWAGPTSLGTVTTGVWQGTAIAGTFVAQATSSTYGVVKPDNSSITISGGVISSNGSIPVAYAVGSYIWATNVEGDGGGQCEPGTGQTTISAGNLQLPNSSSGPLSGTWRCMYKIFPTQQGLWLRVS